MEECREAFIGIDVAKRPDTINVGKITLLSTLGFEKLTTIGGEA